MCRIVALVLAVAFAVAACSAPRSARCKEVCEIYDDCSESPAIAAAAGDELDRVVKFDETECVAACAALDRDAEGRLLVDRHIDCVERAGGDCHQVLACR
jgi:hypothetical protein